MYELKNKFFEACLRYINKVLKLEINGISIHLGNIAQKYKEVWLQTEEWRFGGFQFEYTVL